MTCLPIVARELRVAARRRSTYQFRLWVVGAAVGVAGVLWLPGALFSYAGLRFAPSGAAGRPLFQTLSLLLLVLCLVEGSRSTSASVSEERRDGTLGLLFLTDLAGHDVVLGKWVALALRPCYAMLAVLPILGLAIPMGGVSGGEFWRMALGLLGVLCFSLSLGMAVSAFSPDGRQALGWSLALLLVASAGPLLAGNVLPLVGWPVAGRLVPALSPAYAFVESGDLRYRSVVGIYWLSILVCLIGSALLLVLASRVTARAWREQPAWWSAWRRPFRWSGKRSKADPGAARCRRGPVGENPAFWLFHHPAQERLFRWMALVMVGLFVAVLGLGTLGFRSALAVLTYGVNLLLTWGIRVGVASQVCHHLVDLRRNGLLDLVLTTPLSGHDVLRGHYRATLLAWLGPVLVPMMLSLATLVFACCAGASANWPIQAALLGLLENVVFLFDIQALFWVGTWFSLKDDRANAAVIKTLVLTQVLPAFLCCGVFRVLPDLLFLGWARRRALTSYRAVLQRPKTVVQW